MGQQTGYIYRELENFHNFSYFYNVILYIFSTIYLNMYSIVIDTKFEKLNLKNFFSKKIWLSIESKWKAWNHIKK